MNASHAISLVERGMDPMKLAEIMTDPMLGYPEGTEPGMASRINTRATSPANDMTPAPETMPDEEDTEKGNAGVNRRPPEFQGVAH